MAPKATPSFMGPITSHVVPKSRVASKWTFHMSLSPCSVSVLEGQSIVPSLSCTGLFLTGPRRSPIALFLPNRRGVDHDLPLFSDVVNIPHHSLGFGPTL